MTPALRQMLIAWHRWIALALAVLLLLQATSGVMIAFKDEAARWPWSGTMRSATEGPRVDPDLALERAHAAVGDCTPERLYFPRGADGVFLLRCRGASGRLRLASVDAVTGRVLEAGSIWAFPFEAADLLHIDLTAGPTGRNVIGVTGLMLATLAALGFAAWWPGRSRAVRALRIPWRGTARQKLVQLHRSAGAVLAIVLFVIAASGAAVAFHSLLERAIAPWLPVGKAPTFEQRTHGAPAMSLAEVEQRALQLFPGDTVRDLRAVAGRPTVTLAVLNPAQPSRPRAVDRVWIDRYDGKTIAAAAADEPAGSRVLGWILPVHTGEALGLTGRLLSFAAGLGLLGLIGSGCTSWILNRVRKPACMVKPNLR